MQANQDDTARMDGQRRVCGARACCSAHTHTTQHGHNACTQCGYQSIAHIKMHVMRACSRCGAWRCTCTAAVTKRAVGVGGRCRCARTRRSSVVQRHTMLDRSCACTVVSQHHNKHAQSVCESSVMWCVWRVCACMHARAAASAAAVAMCHARRTIINQACTRCKAQQ